MTKHWIGMLMLAGTMAWANANAAPGDGAVLFDGKETGIKATAGFDLRLRLDGYSRSTLVPAWDSIKEPGPDVYFYRMRTRPWLKLNFDEDIYVYTRLVSDWRDYGSREPQSAPWVANDNNPSMPNSARWPDELIFDNIYLHWGKIAGTPISLRVGRQDMFGLDGKPVIGNGMVVMDGTPYDGSRTGYFDGARLMYDTETDHVNLFAFYSKHRSDDVLPIIHDREHMLRDGDDAWLAGLDWKHVFTSAFNVEAYYLYGSSDISNPLTATSDLHNRKTFLNYTVTGTAYTTHIVGARLYGRPDVAKWFDYSLEYARQYGEINDRTNIGKSDCSGDMYDARMGFRLAELINGTPKANAEGKIPSAGLWDLTLNLEFTQFGGDDPSTSRYEGWIPTWTAYPIWMEELSTYINGGAVWSNFRQYRAELVMKPMSKLTVTPSYAYLQAVEEGTPFGRGVPYAGNGDSIGHLFSVFGTYQITPAWRATLGYNYFIPGDFFNDSTHDPEPGHWFRLETTYRF